MMPFNILVQLLAGMLAAIADEGGEARIGVRELYSDAMDAPSVFGGTYIGMLAANVYTILQSYECAGSEAALPAWPDDLLPIPPDELIAVDCEEA